MDAYAKDLDRWIPRLIAAWRKARGAPAPVKGNRLSPREVKEVAAGIRRLSLGLTRERELAGASYMEDPVLLGAYLLFYWPISYAQGRQVLGELNRKPKKALDLGSGPGPLAFAAMDAGAAEIIAADRSKAALAFARELALQADEALSTREWDPSRKGPVPEGPFDLVTVSHVLNELFGKGPKALERRAQLAEAALAQLRPGGSLVIVEPALRDTSRDLLQVRDLLVQRGYPIRAPCMWRGNCPALVKESDWCHAERSWQMPPLLEDLARAAGLHKESLKMSYLVLGPRADPWPSLPDGRLFRIVSESLQGKGRQRYIGCGPEGRMGLSLQEKHRADDNEVFFEVQRGDVISITETEQRGDGLALTSKTQVAVVSHAGQPITP